MIKVHTEMSSRLSNIGIDNFFNSVTDRERNDCVSNEYFTFQIYLLQIFIYNFFKFTAVTGPAFLTISRLQCNTRMAGLTSSNRATTTSLMTPHSKWRRPDPPTRETRENSGLVVPRETVLFCFQNDHLSSNKNENILIL